MFFFRSLPNNHLRLLAHPLIRSLTISDYNSDVSSDAPNVSALAITLIGSLKTSDNSVTPTALALPKFHAITTITYLSPVRLLPKFRYLPLISTITTSLSTLRSENIYNIDVPIISGRTIKVISSQLKYCFNRMVLFHF